MVTQRDRWFALADYASDHGMTINYFQYARALGSLSGLATIDAYENISGDGVYIIYEEDKLVCSAYTDRLHFYKTECYYVGVTRPLEGVQEVELSDITTYGFPIGSNGWISNGEDSDGVRVLHNGGFSFGPYLGAGEGVYKVTLKGSGLDKAYYDCYYMINDKTYSMLISEPEVSENSAELTFYVEDTKYNIQVYIRNDSQEDITISEYVIKRDM